MWIVYYVGSDRVKAMFANEEEAREFHSENGGDLVYEHKGQVQID